ncbi:MAG: hypothetical protein O7D30_03810, partial [Rickettsia endosymbiont of Ixodes persulcatus]|nr:hypothetical protein [Rickettsia endosymbiont of Ixodes persulcatus]
NNLFSFVSSHNIHFLSTLPFPRMSPIDVTAAGVAKLIDNLNLSSAPDPNIMCAKILKKYEGYYVNLGESTFLTFN